MFVHQLDTSVLQESNPYTFPVRGNIKCLNSFFLSWESTSCFFLMLSKCGGSGRFAPPVPAIAYFVSLLV